MDFGQEVRTLANRLYMPRTREWFGVRTRSWRKLEREADLLAEAREVLKPYRGRRIPPGLVSRLLGVTVEDLPRGVLPAGTRFGRIVYDIVARRLNTFSQPLRKRHAAFKRLIALRSRASTPEGSRLFQVECLRACRRSGEYARWRADVKERRRAERRAAARAQQRAMRTIAQRGQLALPNSDT